MAFLFLTCGLFGCLFVDSRSDFTCSTLMDTNIKCDLETCKVTDTNNDWSYFDNMDWQKSLFVLTIIAFAMDFTSVTVQLLLFWPLVMIKGVYGVILTVCTCLDFTSGWLKFVVAWSLIHYQRTINHNYVWYKPDTVEIRLLPSGFIQFSLILSFVAVVMNRVATDSRSPGMPTYLELIEEQRREQKFVQEMASRTSVYKPVTSNYNITHVYDREEGRFSTTV